MAVSIYKAKYYFSHQQAFIKRLSAFNPSEAFCFINMSYISMLSCLNHDATTILWGTNTLIMEIF